MPLADVERSLESGAPLPGETRAYKGIIDQCGGTLCVTFKVVVDNSGPSPCRFESMAPSGQVRRGSTLVLTVGPGSCTASPSP